MIYLLYGVDDFSIEKTISGLKEKKPEAEIFNISPETTMDFFNLLATDSFFSQKRIFILKNFLLKLSEDEKKILIERLEKMTSDTDVIFTEEKEPKGKMGQYLKKVAKVTSFNNPNEKDLISFIKERAQQEGIEIAPLAAERLASFVGPSYWQLEEEILKLALYKKDDSIESGIQTADIDLLVKANFESNIFELLDAIAGKNTAKAISLINSFLESGENEIYILTMIARQFRNIAMAKFEENITEGMLAKRAGLHPYVAGKSVRQARNFDKSEIIKIYEKITWADLSIKSGRNPKNVFQKIAL